VLLEEVDAENGLVLSKRKADRIRGWEHITTTKQEGDVVKGIVSRRIKGGLLVDIGVPVFLPASQVDIRKPGDISRFIGTEIECKILKIDTENHNIVVSRRKLIEEDRQASKEKLLREIEVGQLRKGIVKNVADFGVFVDLGGLDGLLHISDLSWGRVAHPSEVVQLDQEIECMVIGVDRTTEKISLGLKQKQPSPWANVETRFPVGSRVKGTVVNIMNYGAFIRLDEGIEGLVHISEMSWTKRVAHPSDILQVGQEIDVVVLDVNKEKQEISLGIKQLEANPWTIAGQKYPVGTMVTAKVTSLTNYGAFVEIEPGIEGLIHISDLSWSRKLIHPKKLLAPGQEVVVTILEVNPATKRISLGLKQTTQHPLELLKQKYNIGARIKGPVTSVTDFGVFVEVEKGIEGLVHISDISWEKIKHPSDKIKEGDEVEAIILNIDVEKQKVSLGIKQLEGDIWEDFFARQKTGDIVKVKIVRITDFGVFVEIMPGIEGVVFLSELDEKKIEKPGDDFKVGEERNAKIIKMNPKAKKLSLSFKQAQFDLQRQEFQKYMESQDHGMTLGELMKDQLKNIRTPKKAAKKEE